MSCPGSSVVIASSQNFALRRPLDRAVRFFEGFDVTVCAMLRRQHEWWASPWVQAIRTVLQPPWGSSFGSYFEI